MMDRLNEARLATMSPMTSHRSRIEEALAIAETAMWGGALWGADRHEQNYLNIAALLRAALGEMGS